jgi:hypothetical protein
VKTTLVLVTVRREETAEHETTIVALAMHEWWLTRLADDARALPLTALRANV